VVSPLAALPKAVWVYHIGENTLLVHSPEIVAGNIGPEANRRLVVVDTGNLRLQ
jgi:hypothetical protein